ncbi:MAG: OmpA family protein [Filomicrobium sp.]
MSQGVSKLKEILFENEARALTDLERRIEAVAKLGTDQRSALARDLNNLAIDEARFRTEVKSKLSSVFDRAGTEERFKESVAGVLDRALNQAEVKRHDELSEAIAPLVVRTIKREINESQDELVEALYPITGRLVQAYVASAIRDMTDRINSQVSGNRSMLRIKSILTGRPIAELAIAQSQALRVEEIYLIRRGSGELLARWPDVDDNPERDQLMSGILTAINEFSIEAFKDDTSSLRRIDLNSAQVYLRASPSYLLAARCSGVSNAAVERLIDEEFLAAHERENAQFEDLAATTTASTQRHGTLLAETAERIEERVEEMRQRAANDNTGWVVLKTLLWLIALVLAGVASWLTYKYATTEWVRHRANTVISETASMRGYPVRLSVADYGTEVSLSGLAPSTTAKAEVLSGLRSELDGIPVNDGLTVVATGPDNTPQIRGLRKDLKGLESDLQTQSAMQAQLQKTLQDRLQRQAFERSTQRTLLTLETLPAELQHLASNLEKENDRTIVSDANKTIQAVRNHLQKVVSNSANPQIRDSQLSAELARIRTAMAQTTTKLATLLDPAAARLRPQAPGANANGQSGPVSEAEAMAVQTEQFSMLAVALAQAAAIKPPPVSIPKPSPREALASWIRDHAIFFSNGTRFHKPILASRHFDELAELIKAAKVPVRIVGFTDEQGGSDRNTTLSNDRAAIVKRALQSRGVDEKLLIAVGRLDRKDISNIIGASSPNRRVEFEMGFVGELR